MIWFKAILAGILTPPLLGAIYYSYLSYASEAPFNKTVLLITILFSYVLVVVVGLPSVFALRLKEAIPLRFCVLMGVMVSLLTAFLLFSFSAMFPPLDQLIIFSSLGAISGLVVWCVFR